jgi:hypothetical protein
MSRGRHRLLDFFGITPSTKITLVFTLPPLDSQPNTIKNVAVSFHPSLYIQPNGRRCWIRKSCVTCHFLYSLFCFVLFIMNGTSSQCQICCQTKTKKKQK